ncbi:thiol reductant ABC exporter subunit CydD [Streptomyces sp. 891-h]|uniref:thiol reductant ABC exporter subunit CydD n=1 Tax=Streptomyces sp. 891-h TaxID=2720714 RepID=UPI001FA96B23|nr:thiol reductant ABC exporter subunit CydD [Streptomyces sp. 891-h]UNZ16123.1 thiol reductant ABC exporter subunit CydD [Streptomyces sp. 891-h]
MNATRRRLHAEFPALRRRLAWTAVLAAATAGCAITQAVVLAEVLARGFATAAPPERLVGPLLALGAVFVARAALTWGQSVLAAHTAAWLKSALRDRLAVHAYATGPVARYRWHRGELATLLTRGLDSLDPYVTGYLPKLAGAVVTPPAVLVALSVIDWTSALIVVLTLPLVPLFGALVGTHTRERTARSWAALARLGGHFLDVLSGLPTLRAFGRAEHQVGVVRRMAEEHRVTTMRTLRVAFLSALVLELVATLSIALVAVPLGLRLLAGHAEFGMALAVLFLTPEAYLPLRTAGGAFHDSAEGLAVAERAFAILDEPAPDITPAFMPARTGPSPMRHGLALERVSVCYPGQERPVLSEVSLRVRPGERLGVVGPSGAGKSTLLALLLGFLAPASGRITVGTTDLADLDPAFWRQQISWVPQRPHLFAASVADNIRLGTPHASDREVRAAARAAHAHEFIAALPEGYATRLGEHGAGLSSGERQRIAVARAFLRDTPLLLLDEPTAHLDPDSEAAVVAACARLAAGRTTLVVAHRHDVLRDADRIVSVQDGRLTAVDGPTRPRAAEASVPPLPQ